MATGAETEQGRRKRRYQRSLFDAVAELYDYCRLGYPSDVVDFVVATDCRRWLRLTASGPA